MSYNIGSIDIVASEGFAITRPQLTALISAYADQAPEASFCSEDWPARCCEEHRGMLFVKSIDWSGEGSGRGFDFFKDALTKFLGSADLILTWEDGDSHSGIRLLNGQVTEHEVVMALGPVRP